MAQPVELILARNLISSLTVAALLCDSEGTMVFFNDAAGELLGQRFDQTGSLSPQQWSSTFGAGAKSDRTSVDDDEPLSRAGRDGPPAHARICLRAQDDYTEVEMSTVPLRTVDGFKGAIILLCQGAASPDGTEG
jgi:hypothetical protein